MSKPFTTVQAIAVDNGKIIFGSLEPNRDAVRLTNGQIVDILPFSVCFNTGFVDSVGAEIFEGDYLRDNLNPHLEPALVYFDEERGAFCTSHVETLNETEIAGDDEIRYCSYPNATVVRRLIGSRAKFLSIVSSLLDALAATSDVDPQPETEPVPEDTASAEPDSADWGARVDEATGEY